MDRFLLLGALVVISLSLVTAGRFRYPVKPGSALDTFFVRLQLAGNVVSIIIAAVLPSLTGFQGLPWLSYTAAALVVSALAFYPMKLPALDGLRAPTNGKRSVKTVELRRTRWPYQTLFAVGYLMLLAYVMSVFRFYF
jgi:uncharacterized membrane protein YfbV (UPF0208 family)